MSSRSFMDAIRSVALKGSLTEGANEKTSDGMTKDAKRFAQDLHKVTDPGVKHLVQKDSEAKDYEKMFKPDIEKFPTRLADMEPSQSVDKYVEYNSRPVQEAKKLSKKDDEKSGDNPDNEDATGPITNEEKHKKGCECKDCKTVSEIYVNPNNNTPAAAALRKAQSGPNASTLPTQAGQGPASPMRSQGTSGAAKPPERAGLMKPKGFNTFLGKQQYDSNKMPKPGQTGVSMPKPASSVPAVKPGQTGVSMPKLASTVPASKPGQTGVEMPKKAGAAAAPKPVAAKPRPPGSETAAAASSSNNPAQRDAKYTGPITAKPSLAKPGGATQQPYGMNTPKAGTPPKPTPKPQPPAAKPQTAKPAAPKPAAPKASAPKPQAAKPAAPKPQAVKPQAPKPNALQKQMQRSKTGRDALAGPSNLRQSYEIEWNGNSYVMNEAQIQALDAFIEKYGIMEGTAGEFIKKEMEHPEKLTAKGKKQKIKQSLAIYYSKKRRGENP